jgi:hypothetical protein
MKTQLELFPNLPIVKNPYTYWARYKAYLKSDKWEIVSNVTKQLAGYQCQHNGPTCTSTRDLQCHHLSYISLFRERPGIDTICVCGNCHIWIHSHPKIKPDNDNNPLALKVTAS